MSNWIMGVLAVLFGFVGLFMAAAAKDSGIFIFGMAIMVFAVLFAWWMIKTAYDEAERKSADG